MQIVVVFLPVKAVAAFFTLWRSALTNTGLDDVYRKLFRDQDVMEKSDSGLLCKGLKAYLMKVLEERDKEQKIIGATQYLRLCNAVCRFTRFLILHDTDLTDPGLMKIGTSGSSPSLLRTNPMGFWGFKTIEHVAPPKKQNGH